MTIPTQTSPSTAEPIREPAALLDVRAVAALLDCSARHIYRMSDAGKMPVPLKLGALIRWRRQDLDAWLAAGCKPIRTAGRV